MCVCVCVMRDGVCLCVYVHVFYIRMEWMKLKKIYKELQKKQMSQLKETMKQQSNIAEDDDNAAREDEQDASVEESTSAKPQVDTPNHDEHTVTVDITMTTLPADEVEVCVLEFLPLLCNKFYLYRECAGSVGMLLHFSLTMNQTQ